MLTCELPYNSIYQRIKKDLMNMKKDKFVNISAMVSFTQILNQIQSKVKIDSEVASIYQDFYSNVTSIDQFSSIQQPLNIDISLNDYSFIESTLAKFKQLTSDYLNNIHDFDKLSPTTLKTISRTIQTINTVLQNSSGKLHLDTIDSTVLTSLVQLFERMHDTSACDSLAAIQRSTE